MSGKNQHFIPQFLQRGFVDTESSDGGFGSKPKKAKKRKSQVWVFDRGKKPYRTSVRNKGAERYFYGLEDSIADTQITDAESKYAGLVNELRANTTNTCLSSDGPLISELVAHLSIRTKHVRSSMEEGGDVALQVFEDLFRNKGSFEKFIKTAFHRNATEMEESIYARLTPAQQKIARKKLKENPEIFSNALEKVTEEMAASNPFSAPFFQRFRDELSDMARNAHIETFSESVAPVNRIKQLSAFHWCLYTEGCSSFILGDTISICQASDGRYKSYLSESKDVERILLPISSQHIIIGSINPCMQKLDIDAINHGSAAVSRDFFIASRNTDRERNYAQVINTESFVVTSHELESAKKQIKKEYFSPTTPQG